MSILKTEGDRACPFQKIVEIGKITLGLLVENASILAIRKPQFAYYKLRFSRLNGMY